MDVRPLLSVTVNWKVNVVPSIVAGAINVLVAPVPNSVTIGNPDI